MLSKPSWILFLLTIKIFKDDEKLWANVTFPYKTLRRLYTGQVQCLSHSRYPKICDVISAKRSSKKKKTRNERHASAHAVVSVIYCKKSYERKNLLWQVFLPFK